VAAPQKSSRAINIARGAFTASRNELGDYLNVTIALHRARVARTDEFLTEICARLEHARRVAPNNKG
jgi:hypothetical protein